MQARRAARKRATAAARLFAKTDTQWRTYCERSFPDFAFCSPVFWVRSCFASKKYSQKAPKTELGSCGQFFFTDSRQLPSALDGRTFDSLRLTYRVARATKRAVTATDRSARQCLSKNELRVALDERTLYAWRLFCQLRPGGHSSRSHSQGWSLRNTACVGSGVSVRKYFL
jgi:hypothetical protein